MKTKIFTFLVVLIGGLFMSTSAFAQPTVVKAQKDVTAKDGSTVTYSVTGNGTFHWKLSGGSNNNTVTSSATNSVNITWDKADPAAVYNLDVYLVDATGCYSELYRFAITINSVVLSITDPTTTPTDCAWLGTGAISGNTVSANDKILYDLSVDGAGAQNPVTVTYSVSLNATVDTPNRTKDVTFTALAGKLEVDIDKFFVNTTGSDEDFTITLLSAKDKDGNDLSINATSKTAKLKIHSTPTITLP